MSASICPASAAGSSFGEIVLARPANFRAAFTRSRGYARVAATAETVLDVHKNVSLIGTITFGTGASTGSFATAGGGAETFAAGDLLAIIDEGPGRRHARQARLPELPEMIELHPPARTAQLGPPWVGGRADGPPCVARRRLYGARRSQSRCCRHGD
jgi:hypothetical protein